MIPATFTLAVDTANTGTTSDQVFKHHDTVGQKKIYHRSDHTLSERHDMAVTRKMPTRSGNFLGVAKGGVKFTDDYDVTGLDGTSITSGGWMSLEFGLPVGVSDADKLELRQRMHAAIDRDDLFDEFFSKLEY